jgi:hypothetical protein
MDKAEANSGPSAPFYRSREDEPSLHALRH